MYILYNILILIVLLVFVLPYYTYRLFTEKGFALRFKQQVFGKIDDAEIAKVMRKDCIWIHGASVGEIVANSQSHARAPRAGQRLHRRRLQYGEANHSRSRCHYLFPVGFTLCG